MKTTKIWYMRHGEVEESYIGSFVGTLDVGLSSLGKHQAEAIAEYLAESPIDVILTSPRMRSRTTAVPLSRKLGLTVEVRPDLAEMNFGEWEGKFWPEIHERDPEFAAKWASNPADHACPGGETTTQFSNRVSSEFERILKEYEGKTIAIFAHAGVNRVLLSQLINQPYLDMFRFAQDYGCVNAGAVQSGNRQVALLNLVPGPKSTANGDGGRVVEE